jgi:hypothetical protein
MALTSGELTIGNQALVLIGQKIIDSTDTSTADTGTGGKPYEKLELVFDQTRNALQRSFEWNFARARLALVDDWATATDYTTDMYVWEDDVLYKCNTAHASDSFSTDYVMDGDEYVKDGDDYVRDDSVTFYWDMVTDRPENRWSYRYTLPSNYSRFQSKWLRDNDKTYSIEGLCLLTNLTELNIEFIKKVTTTSEFDDLYTEVLIFDLAIKLTYSLLGAAYSTQALRKELRTERRKKVMEARGACITENNQRGNYNWSGARYATAVV